MYIVSNTGDFECKNAEEFVNKLKFCFACENGNDIWCYIHRDKEFPCMAILVGKSGASITYFSENNEEQFVSVGNQEMDGLEEVLGGQYMVERAQIISFEEAIECAVEFFETHKRPMNIKWDELFE